MYVRPDKQKASANCLLTISKFRKPCCREKGGLGEKAISFQFSLIHLAERREVWEKKRFLFSFL